MADQSKTVAGFNAAIDTVSAAINRLDAAGVPKKEAAELAGRLWTDACMSSGAFGQPGGGPPAAPGPVREETKDQVLAELKPKLSRLGITREDINELYGEAEKVAPTDGTGESGATNDRTPDQQPGDAGGRAKADMKHDKKHTKPS